MAELSEFKDFFKSILKDDNFKKLMKSDVLGMVDAGDREDILKAALRCIFAGPRGVKKMAVTAKYPAIKNQRHWLPFCTEVLALLKKDHTTEINVLKKISQVYLSFNDFWPACDAKLKGQVDIAREAVDNQPKDKLAGSVEELTF